ncbi:hypothetical protein Bbelb_393930 [Branchiostoma belcheri]|nr:hypothetical protein Bbelb_393930 [Branchiostoma belcheri]
MLQSMQQSVSIVNINNGRWRTTLTRKEMFQLQYEMRCSKRVHQDDWVGTYAKAQRLRDQGICIFFQEYDPDNKDPDKRPFVLVLQTEWQRQMAERFSPNSVWTVDSTFAMRRQSLTEKRAIERAVQNDPLSWEDGTKCRLLLCWFHVKKAWTENLLPNLVGQMAADVYDKLCEPMLQPTWQSFDDNFAQFYAEYEDVQQVTKYLRGWD